MKAYRVYKEEERFFGRVETVNESILPATGVTVEVHYSSINYKDALSARGAPGVTGSYPHTPGIDAAGSVADINLAESQALDGLGNPLSVGDPVIVTGYDLGVNTPGGLGGRVRVPPEWILPLPQGMTERDAMRLGTAGLTAGLSVLEIERAGVYPDDGPVVVTGASGGVGGIAIGILARAGYSVTAVTRSPSESGDRLRAAGAADVVETEEIRAAAKKPLARSRWAAAVDAVGGDILAALLAALRYRGVATACGLVGGTRFDASIMPFILRGARLVGIDSVYAPVADRQEVWKRLADSWRPEALETSTYEITLEQVDAVIDALLEGKHRGRAVVRHERE
ncbi:MAG: YhdH/YhfP family quinone oxidoreductase [Spirochaetales bacterium]